MMNPIEKAVYPVTEETLARVQEQLTEDTGKAENAVSVAKASIRLDGMPVGTSLHSIDTEIGLCFLFNNNGTVTMMDKFHEFSVQLDHDDLWRLAEIAKWLWKVVF